MTSTQFFPRQSRKTRTANRLATAPWGKLLPAALVMFSLVGGCGPRYVVPDEGEPVAVVGFRLTQRVSPTRRFREWVTINDRSLRLLDDSLHREPGTPALTVTLLRPETQRIQIGSRYSERTINWDSDGARDDDIDIVAECERNIQFRPLRNHTYMVDFVFLGDRRCDVQISEQRQDANGNVILEPIQERPFVPNEEQTSS